jgi:hypothetical protein
MGRSVAAKHVEDLSNRIACRGNLPVPEVVGQWYAEIRRTSSKREADSAYRLYAMVSETYSAGRGDGGPALFGHVENLEVTRMEANMPNNPVNIDARGAVGNVFNIADYLVGVSNTVTQTVTQSQAGPDVKALMKELSDRIAAAASQIKDEKVAKQLGQDATNLSGEVAGAQRKKWYELSLSGLKEAAVAVGEVGKPILDTVMKLAPLLGVAAASL